MKIVIETNFSLIFLNKVAISVELFFNKSQIARDIVSLKRPINCYC